MFVYAQDDDVGVRKLDSMYNYFVTQRNFNHRACLVCTMLGEENSTTRLCKYILRTTYDCWITVKLFQDAGSCGTGGLVPEVSDCPLYSIVSHSETSHICHWYLDSYKFLANIVAVPNI